MNKCPWELFSIYAQISFVQDPTLVWQDVNYQLVTKHPYDPVIKILDDKHFFVATLNKQKVNTYMAHFVN